MNSLSINDLKNISREMLEISQKQQGKILGGGEETTIVFIGSKPPKLIPVLSNLPVLLE